MRAISRRFYCGGVEFFPFWCGRLGARWASRERGLSGYLECHRQAKRCARYNETGPTSIADFFSEFLRHLAPFAAKVSFAAGDIRNAMNPSAASRCDVFAMSTAVYLSVL
jgi:hypothetical protein